MISSGSPDAEPPCTWRRIRFLGKGAYAVVYLAESANPNNNREIQQVAVKSSRSRRASTLAKEYRIYKALEGCPEIARCYSIETGIDRGRRYYNIFLEYASAGTLKSLIQKSGGDGLPETNVRAFTRTILKGLDYMHARGYVHCDLKPDNVLAFRTIDADIYKLKLADFGVTKEPEERTERKKFRGAPTYMSPESVLGGAILPALDIWSLGCLVTAMVTGKSPWQGILGRLKFDIVEFEAVLKRPGARPTEPERLCGEGKDFLRKCFNRDYKTRWSAKMLLDHPFLLI